jgi:hypothetical protein
MASQARGGLEAGQRRDLRVAGTAGLAFAACYLGHVLLQRPGPADGSAATVAAYFAEHRTKTLLSEAINGIGLIAFVPFLSGLVGPLRQLGARGGATAVLVSGTVFVALGLVSTAAETALVRVSDAGEHAAVSTLFELQASVPIVFAVAAFTVASALTLMRTRLLPRWLGIAGLVAAAVFLVGAILSIFGTAEGESSPFGPLLFLAWMLILCIGLLRAES